MKKIVFALVVVLTLVTGLVACSDKEPGEPINVHEYMCRTTGNYTVVDKVAGKVYLYSGGKLRRTYTAEMSSNVGDGYTITYTEKTWRARTSGAGVYTVGNVDKKSYRNAPLVHLYNAKGVLMSTAIHSVLSSKQKGTRKGGKSAGCIRLATATMHQLYNEGFWHRGDTVLILPEEKGNYIYYEDGEFRSHFGNRSLAESLPDRPIEYNDNPTLMEKALAMLR